MAQILQLDLEESQIILRNLKKSIKIEKNLWKSRKDRRLKLLFQIKSTMRCQECCEFHTIANERRVNFKRIFGNLWKSLEMLKNLEESVVERQDSIISLLCWCWWTENRTVTWVTTWTTMITIRVLAKWNVNWTATARDAPVKSPWRPTTRNAASASLSTLKSAVKSPLRHLISTEF